MKAILRSLIADVLATRKLTKKCEQKGRMTQYLLSHHVIFPTCLEAFTIQGGREGGSWEFSKSALAILLWISSKAVRWAEFIIEAIIELWSGWVALLFSTSSFFFYFLFNEFILRLLFFFLLVRWEVINGSKILSHLDFLPYFFKMKLKD